MWRREQNAEYEPVPKCGIGGVAKMQNRRRGQMQNRRRGQMQNRRRGQNAE